MSTVIKIPAGRFNRAKVVEEKIKEFVKIPGEGYYSETMDRTIKMRDFKTYVAAAAMDGYKIIVKRK